MTDVSLQSPAAPLFADSMRIFRRDGRRKVRMRSANVRGESK
jgi:hypothetical protein